MNREELKITIDEQITNQTRDDSISPWTIGSTLRVMVDSLALKGEIPEIPKITIEPKDFDIEGPSSYLRLPVVYSDGENFLPGGLLVTHELSTSTGNPLSRAVVRRNAGKILSAPATANNEVTTLYQVNNLIENSGLFNVDNRGENPITSSHQSAIIKSEETKIATESGVNYRRNLIIGSYKSEIVGTTNTTMILCSKESKIDSGHTNAIIATIDGNIGINRQNTAIIASNNAIIEDWNSTSTFKWNSAIIAARLGVIQSSNSYTLVTGKANTSNGSAQFVCGQNNIIEPSKSVDDPLKKAFIVGNGTGNNAGGIVIGQPPAVRSNAFHVTQGGKAWVQNEFEIENPEGGVVMTDSVTGTKYRLTIANGELAVTAI